MVIYISIPVILIDEFLKVIERAYILPHREARDDEKKNK